MSDELASAVLYTEKFIKEGDYAFWVFTVPLVPLVHDLHPKKQNLFFSLAPFVLAAVSLRLPFPQTPFPLNGQPPGGRPRPDLWADLSV